jgi:uncharacterized protein
VPESVSLEPSTPNASAPDFSRLVEFLVQPFLDTPSALKLDCETHPAKARVWIRLAFEGSDKGRVFGRNGRNIQAIRTVVEAAAQAVGYTAHLEIYGDRESKPERISRSDSPRLETEKRAPPKRRSSAEH